MNGVSPSLGHSAAEVSKYCSACGAALDTDSLFCPSCGKAPLSVVRRMPRLDTIPDPVWAGTLEVFFAITTVIAVLVSGVTGIIQSVSHSFLGQTGSATGLMLLGMLSLAQLSIQSALIFGLLGQRLWARSLYLWTLAPVVVVTLLVVSQGDAVKGTQGFVAGVLWVGLTALQAFLVIRSEQAFVN